MRLQQLVYREIACREHNLQNAESFEKITPSTFITHTKMSIVYRKARSTNSWKPVHARSYEITNEQCKKFKLRLKTLRKKTCDHRC